MINEFPPFHYVKRDRAPNSKLNRIIRALQPPFNSGELMFVNPLHSDPQSALEIKNALERELKETTAFSTGSSDDILDTLADIYLQREWFGPTGLRMGAYEQTEAAQAQIQKEQYDKALKEMTFGPPIATPTNYSW